MRLVGREVEELVSLVVLDRVQVANYHRCKGTSPIMFTVIVSSTLPAPCSASSPSYTFCSSSGIASECQ